MLGSKLPDRSDRIVVTDGVYEVCSARLTPEFVRGLWIKTQAHKALFWAPHHGELENFVGILLDPTNELFEVYKSGYLIGLVYFSDLPKIVNVQMHACMFDRKLTDKVEIARLLVKWMFENYPLGRIEIALAKKFFSTQRFAERIGFKFEGIRRNGILFRGKWMDEHLFGIIREDVE